MLPPVAVYDTFTETLSPFLFLPYAKNCCVPPGGTDTVAGAESTTGHGAILHACTVEDVCLIGMGSILLNDVHVGSGSVIAAGAVVPEGMRVPPGSLVMGVPARVTRHVDDGLRARIRGTWEHYVAEAARHRSGAFPIERATL